MSKNHVSLILVIETLLVGIVSLAMGLLLGVFLSQFISILTAKLFELNMTSFTFVFSSSALIKTMIYFGVIFILVMIFNVVSMSRNKLINLLTAGRKNEKIKIRNKYLVFITFILSLVFLGYAYYLLLNEGLTSIDDSEFISMLITGVIGTFLLFFSAAGFFLKIAQLKKNFYYKNLNMFILKQVNNKVNTNVISTTIICIMLLLTIGILSVSISLANFYNDDLSKNNKTDFTLILHFAGETRFINEEEVKIIENSSIFREYV